MGVDGPILPARPVRDLGPIRSALVWLLQKCPDHYALAVSGIGEVCRSVRSWAPFQLPEGVGWHARYVYPGVMIDFIYGRASGIDRVRFVGLGVPHPQSPYYVCSSLGFVLLDSAGHPLGLPPTATDTLGPLIGFDKSLSGGIWDQCPLRRLARIIRATEHLLPRSSTADESIAAISDPPVHCCSDEQWLPSMYLPAHVPRGARSDLTEQSRPSAETIWENTMYNYDKALIARRRSFGGRIATATGDRGSSKSGPAAGLGHHESAAPIPANNTAGGAGSPGRRSVPLEHHPGGGVDCGSNSICAMIASAECARAFEVRMH